MPDTSPLLFPTITWQGIFLSINHLVYIRKYK